MRGDDIHANLVNWSGLAAVYRPVSVALALAALVALILGWLSPSLWLHILLLTLVLGVVWLFGMLTWYSFTRQGPS